MDIPGVSMDLAQLRLSDQVGAALLSRSLRGMEDQSATLLRLLDSAAPLAADSGAMVDLLA